MKNKTNHHSTHSKSNRIAASLALVLLTGLCIGSSRAQDTTPSPAPATPATTDQSATPSPAATSSTDQNATTASADQNVTPPADQSMLSHEDKHFIMKAAWASANEVALSQLAADHASSADVKSFAQAMITAHTQLNGDIQTLATQKNVDISKAVEKGQKDDVDSLAAKSGADFDKDYIKKMVKGHEEAVSLFQKESTDGKDTDAMALAAKYLPIVTDHLQHAKTIKQSVDM